MQRRIPGALAAAAAVIFLAAPVATAVEGDALPRTASGRPDFTGSYDVATLTPLNRPVEFGDNLFLTPEQANAIVERERERVAARAAQRQITEPPPPGGAPPIGLGEEFRETSGAGNVGGYNNFWTDRGNDVFSIDGKFRTSIITDPPNGRMPALTAETMQRLSERRGRRRGNDGTAWWLEVEGPGPYDGPESLGVPERCLIGFGSTAGPPILPVLYNNAKRIVQTEDHLMILIEMVHDARIVRIGGEHIPENERRWLGDSIGWWEGDTLVVETTNFTDRPALFLASRNLEVTERFTRVGATDVLYSFTVDDPTVWSAPWSGEYLWPGISGNVYEYACHEGNYAMGNILRGARLLEDEARTASSNGSQEEDTRQDDQPLPATPPGGGFP